MFEKASRLKLRFESPKGLLSVEDLWDLPLSGTASRANLDDVARGLFKQLKSGDDVSFVEKARKSDETLQLKFDVVKHVIDVRLAEAEAASKAKETAEKKQQVLRIIAEKKDKKLYDMPIEDLEKLIATM